MSASNPTLTTGDSERLLYAHRGGDLMPINTTTDIALSLAWPWSTRKALQGDEVATVGLVTDTANIGSKESDWTTQEANDFFYTGGGLR